MDHQRMDNAPRDRHPRRGARGFTLIELIIAVVVLGVALAVAVPSFANLLRSQRLTGTANDLAGALARARSEAIATGAPVRLCPSNNPAANAPCTGGTSYTAGWVVAVDADRDGAIDVSTADRLVRAWQGPDYPVAGFQGPADVIYDDQGLKVANGTDNFDLRADGCAAAWQRRVRVNPVGNFDTRTQSC